MKQKVLGMMSGALMCLSLVFSSCGNVDNPLEEIGNSNPVVAQLKDALADGAVITITFNLNGEQTITFKKGEDGYKFDGPEADNMRYHLEYENGLLVLDVRGEGASLASQIILNPKDNSFYIINKIGYNTTSNGKYSVNGVEGTLTDACPDKATIQLWYKEASGACRAGTRNAGPSDPSDSGYGAKGELVVRYKVGETWQSVIDRYANSDFSNLLFIWNSKIVVNMVVSSVVWDNPECYFYIQYDMETPVYPSHVIGMNDDVALSTEFKYPALCYYDGE